MNTRREPPQLIGMGRRDEGAQPRCTEGVKNVVVDGIGPA